MEFPVIVAHMSLVCNVGLILNCILSHEAIAVDLSCVRFLRRSSMSPVHCSNTNCHVRGSAHDDFGSHIAQVQKEMAAKMQTTELPREDWDTWDPMLISEGLFSAANIFR